MTARDRAAEALRRLVGGAADHFYDARLPTSLAMPKAHVIIAAGDTDGPLDPFDLAAIAQREDRDVLATWVDRTLVGHAFLIDAVITRNGETEQFGAYRLWMRPSRRRTLIPAIGDGPAITIDETGLRLAPARPWRNQIERITGLAQGQAWLHPIIWPSAHDPTAFDRNLDR